MAPTTVKFGDNDATNVVVNSDTELVATTPVGTEAGVVDVVVTTSAGSDTEADGFTYEDEA